MATTSIMASSCATSTITLTATDEAMEVAERAQDCIRAEETHIPQTERHFYPHSTHTVAYDIPAGYAVGEYLGGGAYGNVVKARIISRDGQSRLVAIKKLHQPFVNVLKARRIYRELKLLKRMQHECVIRAVDMYSPQRSLEQFKDVYVVTEYAGTSLRDILKKQIDRGEQILNKDHIRFVIYQVLMALKYIHSANVMHRDVKPENLALTEECNLTLLDFGLARTEGPDLSDYIQTRWYRSPEVIYWLINAYDKQADMWSVGCITAELLLNRPLFPGSDSVDQYGMITALCGTPDAILRQKIIENSSESMQRVVLQSHQERTRRNFYEHFAGLPSQAIDFLDKILVLDPDRRMSVDQALLHPYIKEFHDPEDEPVAKEHFNLEDEKQRTLKGWRKAIWEVIQDFSGDEHSPMFH